MQLVGRSRGRFPVGSLGIFSVVPPTEPCALRSTQPLKVSIRDFSWVKGGRCVWLTTYHPCSAETSRNPGLNLPGTPWATSACRGRPLLYFTCINIILQLTSTKGIVIDFCALLYSPYLTYLKRFLQTSYHQHNIHTQMCPCVTPRHHRF